VTLAHSYAHRHPPLLATSEGSAQLLPDGHILVGWGSQRYVTEFARNGKVLLDLRIGSFGLRSYRSYRFPWSGHPRDRPAIAVRRTADGTTVYASWNGATAVSSWRVLAGPDARHLTSVDDVPRNGFETAVAVSAAGPVFEVTALDGSGRPLGSSRSVRARG
jgi:hypothetical protein